MATTTRGIETPDLGTAYNPPVDLAHMANTIEAMAQQAANYGVGTTTQRTAALALFPNGALWYDTTLSIEYKRVAGAWVTWSTSWGAGPTVTAGSGYTVNAKNGAIRAGVAHIVIILTKSSTITSGDTAFTLPIGWRPLADLGDAGWIGIGGASDACGYQIGTAGAVIVYPATGAGSNTQIRLNMSFPVS